MMKKKSVSSSLFWAKHLALALLLVVIAVVLIQLQSIQFATPKPEGAIQSPSIRTGLSEFYADYRRETRPVMEDVGDFVMPLNIDKTPLDARLQNMRSDQKPVNRRWVGEYKYRTFRAGSTLREAIGAYARSEGMQLIWELDQDFIIKHQFQLDNTIAGSLVKIAGAIDSNFNGEVSAYICPDQRVLVITAEQHAYLAGNCTLLEADER